MDTTTNTAVHIRFYLDIWKVNLEPLFISLQDLFHNDVKHIPCG